MHCLVPCTQKSSTLDIQNIQGSVKWKYNHSLTCMFFPLFFPLLEDYTTHTYAHIINVHIPKRITYSILIILLPNPLSFRWRFIELYFFIYKATGKPKRFVFLLSFVMLLNTKSFSFPVCCQINVSQCCRVPSDMTRAMMPCHWCHNIARAADYNSQSLR